MEQNLPRWKYLGVYLLILKTVPKPGQNWTVDRGSQVPFYQKIPALFW